MQALADESLQLENLCDLLLGQQINLQIEVIPLIYPLGHTVLLHQYKRGEQHRFDGDNHAKQNERVRIELPHAEEMAGVDDEPQGDPNNVN